MYFIKQCSYTIYNLHNIFMHVVANFKYLKQLITQKSNRNLSFSSLFCKFFFNFKLIKICYTSNMVVHKKSSLSILLQFYLINIIQISNFYTLLISRKTITTFSFLHYGLSAEICVSEANSLALNCSYLHIPWFLTCILTKEGVCQLHVSLTNHGKGHQGS